MKKVNTMTKHACIRGKYGNVRNIVKMIARPDLFKRYYSFCTDKRGHRIHVNNGYDDDNNNNSKLGRVAYGDYT